MKTKVDKFHAELRVEGERRMRAANDATNAATAGQRKSSGKALTLVPKVSVKLSTPLRSVNTPFRNAHGSTGSNIPTSATSSRRSVTHKSASMASEVSAKCDKIHKEMKDESEDIMPCQLHVVLEGADENTAPFVQQ